MFTTGNRVRIKGISGSGTVIALNALSPEDIKLMTSLNRILPHFNSIPVKWDGRSHVDFPLEHLLIKVHPLEELMFIE